MNPVRTHVFRRLPENIAGTALDVDSGQLAVAVMPRAALAAKGEDYVRSSCHVFPIYAGESVGVERNEDTVAHIAVTHGSDLTVPENAGEEWVLVMGDPCYFLDGEYGTDDDYGRACRATCGSGGENDHEVERYGFIDLNGGGRAFVSRTVYGDGTYPVRVRPGGLDLTLENEKDEEEEDDGWESEDGDDYDDSDDCAEDDDYADGEDEEG